MTSGHGLPVLYIPHSTSQSSTSVHSRDPIFLTLLEKAGVSTAQGKQVYKAGQGLWDAFNKGPVEQNFRVLIDADKLKSAMNGTGALVMNADGVVKGTDIGNVAVTALRTASAFTKALACIQVAAALVQFIMTFFQEEEEPGLDESKMRPIVFEMCCRAMEKKSYQELQAKTKLVSRAILDAMCHMSHRETFMKHLYTGLDKSSEACVFLTCLDVDGGAAYVPVVLYLEVATMKFLALHFLSTHSDDSEGYAREAGQFLGIALNDIDGLLHGAQKNLVTHFRNVATESMAKHLFDEAALESTVEGKFGTTQIHCAMQTVVGDIKALWKDHSLNMQSAASHADSAPTGLTNAVDNLEARVDSY